MKELEIEDLVKYMTQTYCRMRGKDIVQKFMQEGFKTNKLGEGIRNEVGV